jgi:16S rRNA (adenine1518-N6/adenine1519-N6)-dimethyltransferase
LKKRFGQHFLTDRSILQRIVKLAAVQPDETVVEIGAGAGALTLELAAAARYVVAIEIDQDLIPSLRSSMPPNVDVIAGDALQVQLPTGSFHIVANLPYNIATPLLKRFIEHRDRILDITVMVQKEVAERIAAAPGNKDYGPLSVLIQYYTKVRYGFTVSPGAFKPRPKVDSAVIRLDWKPGIAHAPEFTDFVHNAFLSRRKMLSNNLLSMFSSLGRHEILRRIEKAGIASRVRPEELSVAEFLRVYNQFK